MKGIFSLQEVINENLPRISVDHLMPSFYGLQWGTSFSVAAEILGDSIVLQRLESYLIVHRWVAGIQPELTLYFQNYGLARIEANLYISQSFWEPDEDTTRVQSELYDILGKYYSSLVAYYRETLGPPTFSGTWESPEYPQDELATLLTIWKMRDEAFRVEFEHSDKELPLIVRLSTRPEGNH